MKLNLNIGKYKFASFVLSSLLLGGALSSCEGIYDYEGDCSKTYQVGFTFKMNILDANAFGSQVNSINLLVYDTNGNLVLQKEDVGSNLDTDNYVMNVDLEPGTYTMVAWGGLSDGNSFVLNNGQNPNKIQDATCVLNRDVNNGVHSSKKQLNKLFHGMAQNVVIEDNDEIGVIRVADIDLTKDTNTIRVILTHNGSLPIDPEMFSFQISDANGKMNFDNSLMDDEEIIYKEHTKYDLPTISFEEQDTRATVTVTNSMMAELDLSRLMSDRNPRLIINREDSDEAILNIPITQLLLHAKGEAKRSMPDQEYLDRQDEYTLVFFLTEDNGWNMGAGIYINGWHMRYQSTEI